MSRKSPQILLHSESIRDTYGFTVRPQYLHRFQEYAGIYKEEEEERVQKWKSFLKQQPESTGTNNFYKQSSKSVISETSCRPSKVVHVSGDGVDSTESRPVDSEDKVQVAEHVEEVDVSENGLNSDSQEESISTKEAPRFQQEKSRDMRTWAEISPSLNSIECLMNSRVKKSKSMKDKLRRPMHGVLPPVDEDGLLGEESEEDDMFNENEIADDVTDAPKVESNVSGKMSPELLFPKEEFEFLVQGGIPKDLRGEVWQAFVGARTRRTETYYNDLLATDITEHENAPHNGKIFDVPEKCKKQIEKDLPRTFPGHPALNENGRNSLRRVLIAYAKHNPSVGYCQAMNFFAGLLLLMMPEENAFWTLVGIIDDYFDGYFSQEMTESQVDQLVFEDLIRERFPKLVNHLDYLGVEVAWISGPWFLSIFVNMLPWESVLRVWDVMLFEGNRVMLFRTALALMDLYGPAVVTTKDAGDAISLLQTLASSTFDSSQLVLTACMGFLAITEERLQELRNKHRPAILAAAQERARGGRKDVKGLATKLYSFKHDPEAMIKGSTEEDKKSAAQMSTLESHSEDVAEILNISVDSEVDSPPDLEDQVVWLKAELCTSLEDKRSAILRADELEAALMEIVQQDNRRELSARVEQLEQEVAELRQALADKKEGEKAMIQVLMKVEQEQKVTEEARHFAEQEAAARKYALHILQEKYEKSTTSLAQMEKRAVMAESLLEATLQYESGQSKALSTPAPENVEPLRENPTKRAGLLSFGLGWRDRNKGKANVESKSED